MEKTVKPYLKKTENTSLVILKVYITGFSFWLEYMNHQRKEFPFFIAPGTQKTVYPGCKG